MLVHTGLSTRCDYQAGELNWERRASWDPIHIHRPHPPSTSIQPSTHSHREQMTNDTFASPSSSASAYSRPVNTSAWPLIQAKSLVDKRYQDPLRLSLSLTSLTAVTHNLLPGLYFLCISPHDQLLAATLALVQDTDRTEMSLTVARGLRARPGFLLACGSHHQLKPAIYIEHARRRLSRWATAPPRIQSSIATW